MALVVLSNHVQARDKDAGLPVWQIEVLDFDPQAREPNANDAEGRVSDNS
jgi:hypothetical protein